MTNLTHAKANNVLPLQVARRICPHCQSPYLSRVQRRVIDRFVGLFGPLKRYHCESCGWQGNLKFANE